MSKKEARSIIAHNGLSLKQLTDNGFSLKELKDNGFSLKELIDNGFSPKELKDVGARYLKTDFERTNDVGFNGRLKDVIAFCYNGFTLKELIYAGFSSNELNDVGARCLKTHEDFPLTNRVGLKDIRMPLKTLYNVQLLNDVVNLGFSLKYINDTDKQYLRNIGLFLRKLNGYGVSLKELTEVITDFGFRLRDLGFSPKDLAYSGLSPSIIKYLHESAKHGISESPSDYIGGHSPIELRDHRFSLKELIDSGFSLKELIDNGISFKSTEIFDKRIPWRYNPYKLIDTPISVYKLNEVGSPSNVLRDTGLSFKQLKYNGFSIGELTRIVSLKELLSIGLSFKELKDDESIGNFSIDQLKYIGLSPEELKQAGASPNDFWNGGYSIEEIFKLGYTYGEIRNVYKQYKNNLLERYQLEYNPSEEFMRRYAIPFEKLKQLQTLLNKCKPGIFKNRDRNCTYAQTQSRKGGKKTNKRSRRRKSTHKLIKKRSFHP
jgi:hypothetical protein